MNFKKGFTLIELLVVISIIGVLATIVISSLNDAQSRARDARRERDIKTIQTALELYHLDNGTYPTTSWAGSHTTAWENLETILGVNLPEDPQNTSSSTSNSAATNAANYVYSYFGHPSASYCAGQAYMIVYNKEGSNGTGSTDGVRFCDNNVYAYGNAFVTGSSPRSL